MTDLDLAIQAFYGQLHEYSARVFVMLDEAAAQPDWRLEASVKGPDSPAGDTLPATHPMTAVDGSPRFLAATVPDPCFWTTDQAATYRVRITVFSGNEEIQAIERTISLKPIRRHGGSLFFGARRWVLRGVGVANADRLDMELVRNTETTLVAHPESTDIFRLANGTGVRVVADFRGTDLPISTSLRRLAREPSCLGAILEPRSVDTDPRLDAPNLQLICPLDEQAAAIPEWADAVLAGAANAVALDHELPVIVERANGLMSFSDARAAVDALQASLAPRQFAGYLVKPTE